MQIQVSGHQVDTGEALRAHVEDLNLMGGRAAVTLPLRCRYVAVMLPLSCRYVAAELPPRRRNGRDARGSRGRLRVREGSWCGRGGR